MKRIIIAGLAAAIAVVGIMGAALASAGGGGKPAGSAGKLPVAFNGLDGWSHGQSRLGTIYIGESNVFLRVPRWSGWSATSATATGTLWVNSCTPTCAAGHYQKYPAKVTLWQVAVHHGARFFSRMRLRYVHNQPRDYTYRWSVLPGATIPGWNGGPR